MAQGFWQSIVTMQAAGSALASSAVRTSLTGTTSTQAQLTMPAGTLKNAGDQLLIKASGVLGLIAASNYTLTLDWAIGGTAILTTGAMATSASTVTGAPWELEFLATVQTVGTGTNGTLRYGGHFASIGMIAVAAPATGPGAGYITLPYGAALTTAPSTLGAAGFDTTIANKIDLYGTWSSGTNADTITCQQYSVTLITATGF